MDTAPILHVICVMAVQGLVRCITDDWACSAAIACTLFITRGYTQTEYRWIERFDNGHRYKMPWWGGFDPHAQDMTNLIDLVVPIVVCAGSYGCILIPS